jgi:hypothetical protein
MQIESLKDLNQLNSRHELWIGKGSKICHLGGIYNSNAARFHREVSVFSAPRPMKWAFYKLKLVWKRFDSGT